MSSTHSRHLKLDINAYILSFNSILIRFLGACSALQQLIVLLQTLVTWRLLVDSAHKNREKHIYYHYYKGKQGHVLVRIVIAYSLLFLSVIFLFLLTCYSFTLL